MTILSLDTSSRIASAAIYKDGEILAECERDSNMNHSCTILPVVEQMLQDSKISLREIDVFAATIGPGSFTGIRIGVSAIKGYAWALNKPCAAVSTLVSGAYSAIDCNGIICSIIKARAGEYFYAFFKSDGNSIVRLTDDKVALFEEILTLMVAYGSKIYISGDNSKEFIELCEASDFHSAVYDSDYVQGATSTAICSGVMTENSELVSAGELTPLYLRLCQAEQALQNRKGNSL